MDGPAGAGKSSVCRLLAQGLDYVYLDTGAMYRAVAWALIQEGFRPEEEPPPDAERLARLSLHFSIENGSLSIMYRGKALKEELRRPDMAQRASRISQIESVRSFLTQCQRKLAASGKVVAEGRDMATVVFPDAPVKVFLTADLPTRAERRRAEYLAKGIPVDFATLEARIRARDEADQKRALAPLRPAPDALVLDTSHMDISEVVSYLLEHVSQKVREHAGFDRPLCQN